MDKSLGTLLPFWGIFQFTHTMLDACIQNFFRVSTLYRSWGGGRTARKFRKGCTVLRGNRQMTEKYEYCSTIPRTFVRDCSLSQNLLCTMVLSRQKEGAVQRPAEFKVFCSPNFYDNYSLD